MSLAGLPGAASADTSGAETRTVAGGRFERTVPADPRGSVEISNVAGRIDVSGWDNPQVDVHGQLSSGVDRIDVSSDKGRTVVKVVVPNHSFRSGAVDLTVRVPRGSELEISATSADIAESDVEGSLQLRSVSGNVKADLFGKDAEIKTISGDISIRGRGQDASTHVTTVSGSIRIDRLGGNLDATTISGDLAVHLDPTRTARLRSTSGDLGFEGTLARGASVDAETVSGDLRVRAVPEAGLDYEVATFSGEIKNCMGAEPERVSKYGPGERLRGSHGTAAGAEPARVRLKTMSGDVELCDHS